MQHALFAHLDPIQLLSTSFRALYKMIGLLGAVVILVGCLSAPSQPTPTQIPATATPSTQLANPASENCVKQGGMLTIQKRGDGGEYGVCAFEDHLQCEEWAMLRGECPVGGIEITGYATQAAQYCAITGGAYQATANLNTEQERGNCVFKNGAVCDVWAYFNGTCSPDSAPQPSSFSDPFAYCAAVGTVDTPDARYTGPAMPDVIVQGLIAQGIVAADTPAEFQRQAVWRCMAGKVWACHFGANLPCQEKADMSQEPTAEINEFCKNNPTADAIPASVTGHATVYEWTCKEGKPQVGRQILQADPQGYLADFWYELSPQPGQTYRPPAPAECQSLYELATQALGTSFTLETSTPFIDPVSGETGLGCGLTATGTGTDFAVPSQVKADLVKAFAGWSEQPTYAR